MIPVPGVYVIRNNFDDCVYVGSSHNVAQRWKEHQSNLEHGTHPNPGLQRAWQAHGSSAFHAALLEPLDANDSRLDAAEKRWAQWLSATGATLYANPRQSRANFAPHASRMPALRRLRELAALSQRDLAARAGIAASTVARLEQGDSAYPSTVRKLSDALRCEPSDLIGKS